MPRSVFKGLNWSSKLNKEKDKVNRDRSSIEKEIRDLVVDLESRKTRLEVYKDNIDKLEASLKSLAISFSLRFFRDFSLSSWSFWALYLALKT